MLTALDDPRQRRKVGHLLLAAWVATLVLPAVALGEHSSTPAFGAELLGWGWLSIFALHIGWLANPLLLVLVVVLRSGEIWPRLMRRSAILLILSALNTLDLFLRPMFWHFGGAWVGYYLWMATNIAAATIALIVVHRAARRTLLPSETGMMIERLPRDDGAESP
jgi:hypothetical protein